MHECAVLNWNKLLMTGVSYFYYYYYYYSSNIEEIQELSFEDAKKLLEPSIKYKVEDLISRCLTTFIGGTTDENCLQMKLLAFEYKNDELSKFLDSKLEAMLKTQPASVARPEYLQSLTLEQVRVIQCFRKCKRNFMLKSSFILFQFSQFIHPEKTKLSLESVQALADAWLKADDRRAENMTLVYQLKVLLRLHDDEYFKTSIFDEMPGGFPTASDSYLPPWVLLSSTVSPKKFAQVMKHMIFSGFTDSDLAKPTPAAAKVAKSSGKTSMTDLLQKRKASLEAAANYLSAEEDEEEFVKPKLEKSFKIPKRTSAANSRGTDDFRRSPERYDPMRELSRQLKSESRTSYGDNDGRRRRDSGGSHYSCTAERHGFHGGRPSSPARSVCGGRQHANGDDAWGSDSKERVNKWVDHVEGSRKHQGGSQDCESDDWSNNADSRRPRSPSPGSVSVASHRSSAPWRGNNRSPSPGNGSNCSARRGQNGGFSDFGSGRGGRGGGRGRGGGGGGGRGGSNNRGDTWPCPCGFRNNYSTRTACYRCNEPRPGK